MDLNSKKPNQRITDLTRSCLELFNDCFSKDRVAFVRLEGEERRLWAWSASLRVFAKDHVNLDAQLRLEKHAQIREMVLLLLNVLRDNLSFAFDSVSSSKVTESNRNSLDIPLFGVEGSLKRLETIAAAILQATQASLTRRVIAYAKKQQDYKDIVRRFSTIILARYRGLGPTDMPMFIRLEDLPSCEDIMRPKPLGLFFALVKCSVVRHYRIIYERNETDKDNKKALLEAPLAEEPKPPEDNSDRTTERPNKVIAAAVTPLEGPQQSKTSNETLSESKTQPLSLQLTVFKEKFGEDASVSGPRPERAPVSEAGIALYPRPPKLSEGQKDATCPICKKVLSANEFENLSWISHVNKDIKPYVCISEECMPNLQFFESRASWIDHMHKKHTTQWIRYLHNTFFWNCPVCHVHSPTEFTSKGEMEENLVEHMRGSHSDVVEESDRQYMASLSGVPQHRPVDICPICGEQYQGRIRQESPPPPSRESTEEKGGGFPTTDLSTRSLGSTKKPSVAFVPTRSDDEDIKRPSEVVRDPSKTTRLTGVEKCIGDHLKALAFYFSSRVIEDENKNDIKEEHESSSVSGRSADTRLLGLGSLPSVGSQDDPPQFPLVHYDGSVITDKEEDMKNCIARNLQELHESYQWDQSRRVKDPKLSLEDMEILFPDKLRQSNERIWNGMDPRYALAYAACVFVVLDLCKKACLVIEKKDNNTQNATMQLQTYLTTFSDALNRFPGRNPETKIPENGYVSVIEECASDSWAISAQLSAGLHSSSGFDDTALDGKALKEKLLEIERTLKLRIVLVDINSHLGDIQLLDEQEVRHLDSSQWNLINQIVLAIKGGDPNFLQVVKDHVDAIIQRKDQKAKEPQHRATKYQQRSIDVDEVLRPTRHQRRVKGASDSIATDLNNLIDNWYLSALETRRQRYSRDSHDRDAWTARRDLDPGNYQIKGAWRYNRTKDQKSWKQESLIGRARDRAFGTSITFHAHREDRDISNIYRQWVEGHKLEFLNTLYSRYSVAGFIPEEIIWKVFRCLVSELVPRDQTWDDAPKYIIEHPNTIWQAGKCIFHILTRGRFWSDEDNALSPVHNGQKFGDYKCNILQKVYSKNLMKYVLACISFYPERRYSRSELLIHFELVLSIFEGNCQPGPVPTDDPLPPTHPLIPSGFTREDIKVYETLLKIVGDRAKAAGEGKQLIPHIAVVTDLATDYDGLLAMMCLKELHRLGVVHVEGFIANLLPPYKRALFGRGALDSMGYSQMGIPVGIGTVGGLYSQSYEFDNTEGFIATPDTPLPYGEELLEKIFKEAAGGTGGHKITALIISSLMDIAKFVKEKSGIFTNGISNVVLQGGYRIINGKLTADFAAQNNKFDEESATFFHTFIQENGIHSTAWTEVAATAVPLYNDLFEFLEQSGHPLGFYLRKAQVRQELNFYNRACSDHPYAPHMTQDWYIETRSTWFAAGHEPDEPYPVGEDIVPYFRKVVTYDALAAIGSAGEDVLEEFGIIKPIMKRKDVGDKTHKLVGIPVVMGSEGEPGLPREENLDAEMMGIVITALLKGSILARLQGLGGVGLDK